ncbi:MAG TPA: glycogen debranching N-terminal domain-containing protein [Thermomicrobiales bacterium]|nr:glycogen debranching N-terminal domain-containing protein [Thermomicrobiales bacterium]
MTRDNLTTVTGYSFIVTDRLGDITQSIDRGLFVADTRFLSSYALRLNNTAPVLLRSGSVGFEAAQIYATNVGLDSIPNQSLSLIRHRRLGPDFTETIELQNHGAETVELQVTLEVDADFADMFEVRSFLLDTPPPRSTRRIENGRMVFASHSSKHRRMTSVGFSRPPDTMTPELAAFRVRLAPDQNWTLEVTVDWTLPPLETALPVPAIWARTRGEVPLTEWFHDVPRLQTDDHTLLRAYNQSIHDLVTLELALSSGHAILAAGVPWYMAIFGRDAIISSLQILPIAPRFAIGTLRTLAAYQAVRSNDFRDAEPGKMPHEIRFGALSESNTVPHARYYGTVDATPLWLILFAATYRWTGDTALVQELLPVAQRALRWIDTFGDRDGDGFVEYQTRSRHGLANQGWKDSWDAIRFADGRLAEPPIALVEVQGYVYAAKLAMAELYASIGQTDEASALKVEARDLKIRTQAAFWMPAEQSYAMALDGKKRQVDGIASNQGQLLWTGLPDQEFGERVVDRLMAPDSFSGWGIRTLASSMSGYNPIGYHTGSVWPHDTALIAAGFRRYGRESDAAKLADGLLDATNWFEDYRLPELFGGWDRGMTPFPVDFPVACSPQAWAAGATIMLLAELAGLAADHDALQVTPIASGRHIVWTGLPFKGNRFDIDVTPGGQGSLGPHLDP